MRTKPEDFQFFIDQITSMDKDELNAKQEDQHRRNEIEYKKFLDQFSKNSCYICEEKLIRCDYSKPCIHWLLRKHKRIKKKNIEIALKSKDLFQIISYLRWLASMTVKGDNINDFEGYEINDTLVYHETISFENIT
ncbi:MAG TPA: hypothetical protein VLF89_09830, partial [Candidatus Saccharimonadales bacterium]|nr:hypothetical protein [Candidatus Saccharimonadales bacterium]